MPMTNAAKPAGDQSLRTVRISLAFVAAVAVFSLWMRTGFPVHGIGGSVFDDELFVKLARSLVEGHWLGTFDNNTLVKGPFYPIFIAAAFICRIPLKLAEQFFYLLTAALAAALIAAIAPYPRHCKAVLGTVVFVVLALSPVLWFPELARVIREGIYGSLSLAVVVLSVMACLPPPAVVRRIRPIWIRACLGLVGGMFWLTREEGLWLLPAIAVIGAIALVNALRRAWNQPAGIDVRPWRVAAAWAVAPAIFILVVGSVCALNFKTYGVFEITEVGSAEFRHAYGALARIKPDGWQRFVVFPRDVRERAYKVSPAAQELAPTLDGPFGLSIAEKICAEFRIEPCTGIHAGWFQWTLRDAVVQAGHYASARDAAAFYATLARQLDAACADGRLACLPPRATLAPPLRPEYLGDTMREAPTMLRLLLQLGGGDVGSRPSQGSRARLMADADMVGNVMPAREPRFYARGWIVAPEAPRIELRPRAVAPFSFDMSLDLAAAPDVEAAFPGQHAARFELDTDCPPADCDLAVSDTGSAAVALPLQQLAPGRQPVSSGPQFFVEEVRERTASPQSDRVQRFQVRIARAIGTLYGAVAPIASAIAAVALLVAIATRRCNRWPPAAYALALASAAAIATRVVLLSYLQVTSIPSENFLYLSPAAPFVILFVLTGLLLGADSGIGLLRTGSPRTK